MLSVILTNCIFSLFPLFLFPLRLFFCSVSFKTLAQLLGFEDYITPYASARGQDILRGVNYASAAAGIRDETGRQLVTTTTISL